MSQPFKLFRLQQIDSQLDQTRARIEQINLLLSSDLILREAQARADAASLAYEEARKTLKRAEEESQAQQIKIQQTEASLYGGKVRSPKELQDLQNEAAALKRYLSVLEDRQLDIMMTVEELENEQKSAQQTLKEVQARQSEKNAALASEQSALENEVIRLEQERTANCTTVSAEDLQLYEQLRQQRRGIAVAKITNKGCSACGSTLTPGLIQTAQSAAQIVRCTFCGRILYAG